MTDFNSKYNFYLNYFNDSLASILENLKRKNDTKILETCKYSVLNGGKRIRPILCLSTGEILGVNKENLINLALAIEFIHSYSLVHDDLPCMDNDDYRRGKLSTHKMFGEYFGVLCGDALLNLAFETALSCNNINNNYINALKLLAEYSGHTGMIYGQTLDLDAENNKNNSEEFLLNIYLNKTAKLITAPLLTASILANNIYYNELQEFGKNLGYLFQMQDDILDETSSKSVLGKTIGKDKKQNKLTAIKVYGLNAAKERIEILYSNAINILKAIPNSQFLVDFTNRIYSRTF